jgi:glycosyltransferase involved in cell wall biosynthesis
VIKKYKHRIARLVSEKDNGIYDAMNKGLSLATGEYVLFMNSGDEIYDSDTVKNVFAVSPGADIYYGETEMYNQRWESLGERRHKSPARLTHRSFRFGMSVSHQAIVVRRSVASSFNTEFNLSADIDWILNALKRSEKVVNVQRYVAKYLVGGTSKKRHIESLKERFVIFTRHYGLIPNLFNHVIISINLVSYYLKNRRTND